MVVTEDLFDELVVLLGQLTYENHQLQTKVLQLEQENKILKHSQQTSLQLKQG